MKWFKSEKKSIQFKLISMVSSLMIGTFVIVIVVFNLLFTQYIETTATGLLSFSGQGIERVPMEGRMDNDEKGGMGSNEIVRDNNPAFAVSVNRALIGSDYELRLPADFPVNIQQDTDSLNFVEGLENQDVSLEEVENARLEWNNNLYYYTLTEDDALAGSTAAYFINMTDLYNLENYLNLILVCVMVVALILALVVTYFISLRIANPMRSLAVFAKRIGEGEYDTINDDFSDQELHELKQAMNETTTKLRQYDTEQRAFFQNASHELRTPLQIIKNTAEGIEYGIVEEKTGTDIIKTETDKLSDLVEDILFLSRLESKSPDRITSANDLRETLSYTAERYSRLFEQNNVQIIYDFSEAPVYYKYDERELERIFQNLLSNALRYAQHTIRLICKEQGDRIILGIYNDGEAISEEDLPHIFDRFYFGKKGVHGIGLSIVKAIVASYKGRIEVHSDIAGTTFTLYFNKSSD
ncbi:sensor histidine kinase [Marinilactibacillus psychrotolerans]|uniref:histidine kinase n=1 Tax=Marinilactibacillus psychrotolerans TaxID=191770 RepID=A0AAV3WT21_9LACT|nr:HAMP domain-containing sensor histidine kinase [Marinilactibacillus psychrotolerans]GEL66595.1 two-component sensor histidine kinase [Marinilactibacillus psychrotolerans]GEQ35117.1 two-component sensor histidine kinase [Marinilactibacillus psychrotolerans]SDC82208.1 Signal transduction histidine kinase [Marinilactibacillus psychrotolerans]